MCRAAREIAGSIPITGPYGRSSSRRRFKHNQLENGIFNSSVDGAICRTRGETTQSVPFFEPGMGKDARRSSAVCPVGRVCCRSRLSVTWTPDRARSSAGWGRTIAAGAAVGKREREDGGMGESKDGTRALTSPSAGGTIHALPENTCRGRGRDRIGSGPQKNEFAGAKVAQ